MSTHVARPSIAGGVTKPLGRKAYGSIGHLPGSKLGPGDHHLDEKQAALLTHRKNPQHHGARVVVQQKIDGSCCAVAKIGGVIVPLGRAGYPAATAPYQHLRDFHVWAVARADRFDRLLSEGERVVGEWLSARHSLEYVERDAVGGYDTRADWLESDAAFVAFDIMRDSTRALHDEVHGRVSAEGLLPAHTFHVGAPTLVANAWSTLLDVHTAFRVYPVGEPEGLVYRYEHAGAVKFLGKWVRADFEGRVPEGGDLREEAAQ